MHIISGVLTGFSLVPKIGELSRPARQRLKWMDYYQECGGNARRTCRHFDMSPQTFYRWHKRYNPHNLSSLEDHSRRPRRVRRPTWSPELAQAVVSLREQHPRWGKQKLAVLLAGQGVKVSVSMVGRILLRT